MVLAAVLSTSIAGSAFAQATTPATESPPQTGAQEQQQLQQLKTPATVGTQSQGDATLEGPTVTYAQVLQNPDDPTLNAGFARTEIRKGNLLAASAALERILLTHPNSPELRLLYSFVLFRLDDLSSARREVNAVDPKSLPPQFVAERAHILQLIDNAETRAHQAITVGVGVELDSDRNSAPQSGTTLLLDTPFTVTGSAYKTKDAGALGQFGYDLDYDLDTDPKSSLYASFNLLGDHQAVVVSTNSLYGGIEAGLKTRIGAYNLQVGLLADELSLAEHPYMHEYGLVARPSRQLNDAWDIFAEARAAYQSFPETEINPTGPTYNGFDPSVWVGVGWKPVDTHRIAASIGYEQRYAVQAANAYDHPGLRLSDTWVLPAGQFVAPSVEFGFWQYHEPNQLISSAVRQDHTARYDVTYGVPLGTVASLAKLKLPDQIGSMVVSLSAEYFREESSIPNYNYWNVKGTALVSKRWEF